MKNKERVIKDFDYTIINNNINKVINSKKTKCISIYLLYSPELSFEYGNGWSVGIPDKKRGEGTITSFSNKIFYIDFRKIHHTFKEDEIIGRIGYFSPVKYINNDNHNDNILINGWNSIIKELQNEENFNLDEHKKIIFNNKEELFNILQKIKNLILIYNTDSNDKCYCYFSEEECNKNKDWLIYDYKINKLKPRILELSKELLYARHNSSELQSIFDEYNIDLDIDNEHINSIIKDLTDLSFKYNKLKEKL